MTITVTLDLLGHANMQNLAVPVPLSMNSVGEMRYTIGTSRFLVETATCHFSVGSSNPQAEAACLRIDPDNGVSAPTLGTVTVTFKRVNDSAQPAEVGRLRLGSPVNGTYDMFLAPPWEEGEETSWMLEPTGAPGVKMKVIVQRLP